jgi:hypothetical protein
MEDQLPFSVKKAGLPEQTHLRGKSPPLQLTEEILKKRTKKNRKDRHQRNAARSRRAKRQRLEQETATNESLDSASEQDEDEHQTPQSSAVAATAEDQQQQQQRAPQDLLSSDFWEKLPTKFGIRIDVYLQFSFFNFHLKAVL